MQATTAVNWMELTAVMLFGFAVLHMFSVKYFEHLAFLSRGYARLWRLFGQVEVVFGFWALGLLAFMVAAQGWRAAVHYLDTRSFVEPLFVCVVLVVCGSRPILQFVSSLVDRVGALVPPPEGTARYFLGLSLVPLLGSFITEPAAMTLAALMLRDTVFARGISRALKYGTLGVLFVNVSIGGALTAFGASPIRMVASLWGWDGAFVLTNFGWKAAVAVVVNASILTVLFRRELAAKAKLPSSVLEARVPAGFVVANLALLAGVIALGHYPKIFMGLFLVFLVLAETNKRHHDRLMLREGLMVAVFLSGLVVLGGQQQWWLDQLLARPADATLLYGTAALSAITDNATLAYLGSLFEGASDAYKYALVAGAVAGGGLTIIANAPNPAGFAILKDSFDGRSINPLWLLVAAVPPTLTSLLCFSGPGASTADLLDIGAWFAWLQSLDAAILFLLILAFAVAAVAIWSETLRARRDK